MDISVLIVTYNSAGFAESCVVSILKQEGVTFEIIVVDNHSRDNTVQILRERGGSITLIENPENLGFGRGNNLAFQSSRGRYLFLLNPDAWLVSPRSLRDTVDWMDRHPRCGVSGTAIERPGDVARPKYQYQGQDRIGQDFSRLPGEIAWVVGASMVIRRDVFETVAGFDEDFFMYGEEADLCLRVREAGYEIGYNPDVIAHHMGGHSENGKSIYDIWRMRENGKYTFYKKHYERDVVRQLITHRVRRSRYRLLWLSLKTTLVCPSEGDRRKREKYQAVRDAGSRFLTEPSGLNVERSFVTRS